MRNTKTLLLHSGLILFGLLLGLAAVEVGLRVLHRSRTGSEFENLDQLKSAIATGRNQPRKGSLTLGDIVIPNSNDRIIYELAPNLNVRFQRAQVRTNSYGMRGREYDLIKPPDTYRIALLGDSFAFGWGVEEHESFAAVLERNLNRLNDGRRRYEVLNFGVPGYSTFQEAALFEEKGVCFDPDAVLVYFVNNDFGLPFFVRDVRGNATGGLFSALEFSRLVWSKKSADAQVELAKMQGWDPGTAFNRLTEFATSMAIPVFLAINPRESQSRDRKMISAQRRTKDGKRPIPMQLIDLRPGLLSSVAARGLTAKEMTLSFDPHPSPVNHQILGDLMTPYFQTPEEWPN